jgi:hypothetical protein
MMKAAASNDPPLLRHMVVDFSGISGTSSLNKIYMYVYICMYIYVCVYMCIQYIGSQVCIYNYNI